MSLVERILWWAIAGSDVIIIVRHHVAYLRQQRAFTFGAFLETAGWIVITLVGVAALGGVLSTPGTRTVEITAGIVDTTRVGIGAHIA